MRGLLEAKEGTSNGQMMEHDGGFPLPSLTTSKIAHPKIVLGKLTPKSLIDLGVSQAMVISKCSLDLPCLNAGQCIGACQYVFVEQNQRC